MLELQGPNSRRHKQRRVARPESSHHIAKLPPATAFFSSLQDTLAIVQHNVEFIRLQREQNTSIKQTL